MTEHRHEPQHLDGTTYGAKTVRELRESAIEMRDASLKASAFVWAVSLSHIVAALGMYANELEKDEKK